jgi:hypothetical protein
VNLIRFIRPSLLKGQTLNLRGGNTQWQVTSIKAEILSLRPSGIFVMQLGALESYLPPSMSGKNLNSLIEFLDCEDFWERLPQAAQSELTDVCPQLFEGAA